MAIDRFSKERFEAALPRTTAAGASLLRWVRFEGSQYVYKYRVGNNVFIQIYSSIDGTGFARECAEDSIRFVMTDANGQPLSNKLQSYVTRVNGWDRRVTEMFWKVWAMGEIAAKACDRCGESTRKVFMTKKDEPYTVDGKTVTNKGRLFVKCPKCNKFDWLTEAKEVKIQAAWEAKRGRRETDDGSKHHCAGVQSGRSREGQDGCNE
jgi:uncharacterized protein with PIN domain